MTKNLPPDLVSTLTSIDGNFKLTVVLHEENGSQTITFRTLEEINKVVLYVNVDEYVDNYGDSPTHLAGNYYPIEAYDLLSDFPGYRAFGILVWIPGISEFGAYDEDHCVLRTFPNKSFTNLLENPRGYFNCMWYSDEFENHLLRPWDDSRFESVAPTKEPKW